MATLFKDEFMGKVNDKSDFWGFGGVICAFVGVWGQKGALVALVQGHMYGKFWPKKAVLSGWRLYNVMSTDVKRFLKVIICNGIYSFEEQRT